MNRRWGIGLLLLLVVSLGGLLTCVATQQQGTAPSTSPRERLQAHVHYLAEVIGPRSPGKAEALARSADYVRSVWRAQGHQLQEQRYACRDGEVVNLAVEIRGRSPELPLLVVGAHYDSLSNTPGADDNASGVALLLELSRALREAKPRRTIRLVAFTCEEPPYFQTEDMGSLRYARALKKEGVQIQAMLSLESLGYYRSEPGTQHYPPPLASEYPDRGNFVGVVGQPASGALVEQVAGFLQAHSDLPVEKATLPGELEGVGWSDHWSFWQIGVPAVMLTDTAPFRNPNYHQGSDTPETLDYGVLTQVSAALPKVIAALAE